MHANENSYKKQESFMIRGNHLLGRMILLLLVLVLAGGAFGGLAAAADEVATSLEITSDSDTNKLIVENGPITLTSWATITGVTEKRNVTAEATWTSSSASIKVTNGIVTAVNSVSSATITAKYKTVTATYTVSADYLYDDIKLRTIIPTSTGYAPDSIAVELGQQLSLGADGVKTGSSDVEVTKSATWLTSNSSVATVAGGVVTLLSEGTATLTAKYKGKSDIIVITVTSPYNAININEEGPMESLVGSAALQLEAVADLKVGSNTNVTNQATWTTSNAAIVKVVNGLVTPVGTGTATVTVKQHGVSDSIMFIIRTEFEAIHVKPDKPVSMTLYGVPIELSAEVSKGTATPILVTSEAEWTVVSPWIASIRTEGERKYLDPRGVGTTKLTVSHKGLKKEISLTVFPTINAVEIAKDELNTFIEETGSLPSVSGKTTSGETTDISKLVRWTTSDETVVSIEDGKWKALKAGKAILTAEAENEQGKVRTDTITVVVHKKILILIPNIDSMSVVIGKEVNLPTVQLIYEDGEEVTISDEITWKSSTPNLLVKSGKMKGLLPASALLTGTYLDKTVKIKVQVEEEFTSFQVTPAKVSLTLNKSQSIKVVGTTKSGKKVTLSTRVDWKASNELVTMNGSSVKAVAKGSGKLTADVQGKTIEVPYVVTIKLTKLTKSETSLKLSPGGQASIDLTALYENGETAMVSSQAIWTTSKSAVVTVKDGKIKAVNKGSATVKGSFGGKTVSIRVSVK